MDMEVTTIMNLEQLMIFILVMVQVSDATPSGDNDFFAELMESTNAIFLQIRTNGSLRFYTRMQMVILLQIQIMF